jgi:hypothetical protein
VTSKNFSRSIIDLFPEYLGNTSDAEFEKLVVMLEHEKRLREFVKTPMNQLVSSQASSFLMESFESLCWEATIRMAKSHLTKHEN